MTRITASAKINLTLHVTGRRDDGYHELASIVGFSEFGDQLDIKASREKSVRFIGEFSDGLSPEKNSVLDAMHWFERHYNIEANFSVVIEKNIPVMAGLGGGTADCAAMLQFLHRHFDITPPKPHELSPLIALGADVPISFHGQAAIMRGIGDKIEPINIDAFDIVLANPRVTLSTGKVFAQLDRFGADFSHKQATIEILTSLDNNLEAPAKKLAPEIEELHQVMAEHSLLARMSGSGATLFAICDNRDQSKELGEKIKSRFPNYWVKLSRIKPNGEQHIH